MVELTAEEARVLGCLLEKERTVPDSYPLTANALIAACNQSTNRDPVVSYDEETVERALAGLREKRLAIRGVYHGSRVPKHRHSIGDTLEVDAAQSALLCVLLLRGAQTPGELKARTERLHAFDDLAGVEAGLDDLVDRGFVTKLARQPGQKESRYRQLLAAGEADMGAAPAVATAGPISDRPSDAAGLLDRVAALEAEVRSVRAELDTLRAELGGG